MCYIFPLEKILNIILTFGIVSIEILKDKSSKNSITEARSNAVAENHYSGDEGTRRLNRSEGDPESLDPLLEPMGSPRPVIVPAHNA